MPLALTLNMYGWWCLSLGSTMFLADPVWKYLFKVNNRDNRAISMVAAILSILLILKYIED